MKRFGLTGALAVAAACFSTGLEGAVIYVLDNTSNIDQRLVSFDSATPGTIINNIGLTGLAPAGQSTAPEVLIGIDFRPSNGLLYGYASNGTANGRLVTINTATGVVTSVGVGTSLQPNGQRRGFDFDPVTENIRALTDFRQNRIYNANDGTLIATDTDLAYAPADANFGVFPRVTRVAYTNSAAGAIVTTLYGIDSDLDILVRIGGVNGSPSPSGGLLTTIGALGVNVDAIGGFDIDGATGIGYFTSRVGGVSNLYTINLNTGAATLVGAIGTGVPSFDGLSVQPDAPASGVPEPSTFALTLGAAALFYFKRRR
jgi:hypothetical protein